MKSSPRYLDRKRAALAIAVLGFATAAPAAERRRPNIVLIQADDLGYGDLGSYGQRRFATPNLDKLAAEGTRFTQYYSGSTVCAPSRATLLTGLHTGHARIRGNGDHPLLPEDVTVGKLLQGAGYATAVIGKWGLGTADTTGRPDEQGFQESFGFLDHTHAHRQYTDHLWRNGEVVAVDPDEDYVNDLFARAAIEFVGKNAQRPFFLYLSFTVPHAELRVPDESLRPYRGRFPEKPFANPKADAEPTHPPSRVRRPSIGYRSQPEPLAAFAGMVARMDQHVGQLLLALRERGLERDTLVLFTSDNGPHKEGGADPEFFRSNGPLRGIKRDLYEGGIRVPMIARWPGRVKAGATSDQVWAHWDFLPTAAALAGVAAPRASDGFSMLAALEGKRQRSHEFLYWEFHERGFAQAVRMGDWKAVRHAPTGPLELYDLKRDLGEQTNLAASRPDVVRKIEDYLRRARTPSELWPGKPKAAAP